MSTYALVRDKNGNPKFDSWDNIHPNYWAMLTDRDKAYVQAKRDEAKEKKQ